MPVVGESFSKSSRDFPRQKSSNSIGKIDIHFDHPALRVDILLTGEEEANVAKVL